MQKSPGNYKFSGLFCCNTRKNSAEENDYQKLRVGDSDREVNGFLYKTFNYTKWN